MAYSRTPSAPAMHPGAALLAWIFPGLGHIFAGQKRRGFLIMGGLLLMIVTGLLVGGVDCVDRKNDRLWFIAQSMCGPIAFVADGANQRFVQQTNAEWAQQPGRMRREYLEGDATVLESLDRIGLGRVNEMGTLFVALAGLMNLVVILDVLFLPEGIRGMSAALSYIPFLHPISLFHEWWYLLLPVLALGIAMVYKALRLHSLDAYWRQTLTMTVQVVMAMIALAVLLVIVVQILVPHAPID